MAQLLATSRKLISGLVLLATTDSVSTHHLSFPCPGSMEPSTLRS